MGIGELVKSADWKAEKHVPVIDAPDAVKVGEAFEITVQVGKEIAHPNVATHFIEWIAVYYTENGKQNVWSLARAEFSAHGAAPAGVETSGLFADPKVSFKVKIPATGKIRAVSYCNIHGLWESEKEIKVQ